jgi:protein gp37
MDGPHVQSLDRIQKVSPSCDHCYEEAMMDHRYGRVQWGPRGQGSRTSEVNWRQPLKWARQAHERRPRVFCASLADIFDNKVPKEWRDDLWALIAKTSGLDWMLLTKRPETFARCSGTVGRGITCGSALRWKTKSIMIIAGAYFRTFLRRFVLVMSRL